MERVFESHREVVDKIMAVILGLMILQGFHFWEVGILDLALSLFFLNSEQTYFVSALHSIEVRFN